MQAKVMKTIAKFNMLTFGDRVLVGVSGGPDSIALLHLLCSLKEQFGLAITVVHLDHMFRGEESYQDACYVADLAKSWGIPAIIKRINVSLYREQLDGSPQMVARTIRYHLFLQVAKEYEQTKIALGHNLDDQAETVLMRFLRGTGLQGLGGIPPVRREGKVEFIRPLLEVGREEILAYCQEHGLKPRWDSSNQKSVYLRNKVRLDLIPWIEAEINPKVKQTLAENAALWREENEYIEAQVARYAKAYEIENDRVVLDLHELKQLPPVIMRRLMRRVIAIMRGTLQDIGQEHLLSVQQLVAEGQVGGRLSLPGGIELKRTYDEIVLQKEKETVPGIAPFSYSVSVPGELCISELGLHVRTMLLAAGEQVEKSSPDKDRALFDYALVSLPLYIRNRRNGDRYYPSGLGGSKKLRIILSIAKFPGVSVIGSRY